MNSQQKNMRHYIETIDKFITPTKRKYRSWETGNVHAWWNNKRNEVLLEQRSLYLIGQGRLDINQ